MRHESLFFLFSGITRIKGVGGGTSEALMRLLPAATTVSGNAVPIIRDLLFHLPVGLVDRRHTFPLSQIPPEPVVATFVVRIGEHVLPQAFRRGGKRPYKVICSNDTGEITLVFFNAHTDYIKKSLPEGQQRVISGRVEPFDGMLQMSHPDVIASVSQLAEVQKPEPVYPLTVGMTSKRIGKLVADALKKLPEFPEWIDDAFLKQQSWPNWKAALQIVHHPQSDQDLLTESPARQRLAYDEILANQLHLARLRMSRQQQAGELIKGTGKLSDALLKNLPFKLTKGQQKALAEIKSDMASGKRMGRLLQGDVGSGKTVVALLAMLAAAEQKLQSALMVPTEIIAIQHYETLSKFLEPLGVKVALLTGSVKGKQREAVLSGIADGSIPIVVGTHALFQEHVSFSNLALVVIDEQHRFGVEQRMALSSKGNMPHLLHMTATPIPRSLTMTYYGDMDSSQLTEKPAERLPITTRLVPASRYQEMMERLEAALVRGEKAYWICPLIEDTQDTLTPEQDLAAAQSRYTEFKTRFGDKVGLVHGRMNAQARTEAMHDFASGKTRLLVATTVVEVGVDVRDATIMVIEKAERFGLSSLHQLRGRVGRGDKPSFCVLLYSDKIQAPKIGMFRDEGEVNASVQRLSILRESEDGFRIAEADLAIRGGGDLLGTRQSGLPRFIFTDLERHQELLSHAHQDVITFLKSDPTMKTPRGQGLELLLQLFGHDD